MMKNLRAQFSILAVTGVAIIISGCQTSRTEAPAALSRQQPSPFLDQNQYPGQLRLAIDDSLKSHQFTSPWIVVGGSDGSLSFISERFHSANRFDRINLKVTRRDHVTVSITPYQFGPSDWAILGPALADLRPEAELIAGKVASKLNNHEKAR
jgi:hypothetical protein